MQAIQHGCWRITSLGWLLAAFLAHGQDALTPTGGETAIAGVLSGDQVHPQVAINANGGYLVWEDNSRSPYGTRICARPLSSSLASPGPNFLVSAAARSKGIANQLDPQVASLPNGGAVVVWQSNVPAKRGRGVIPQICARFLSTNGTFASKRDILVSRYKKVRQSNPAVATFPDGRVIVVWEADGLDGSMKGIFAQQFTARGAKLGREYRINLYTANSQRSPAVATLGSSNYVVAWISEGQRSATSVDLYARVFSPGVTNNEAPVNLYTTNACGNPAVAGLASGGFLVAWSQKDTVRLSLGSFEGTRVGAQSSTTSSNSWDVFGRAYDSAGAAVTAPFALNSYTYGDQYAPRLSALGNSCVAVWSSMGQDGSWEGVFGRVVTAAGPVVEAEFLVNTRVVNRQIQPAVTSSEGNSLVVWASQLPRDGFDLFAQRYIQ